MGDAPYRHDLVVCHYFLTLVDEGLAGALATLVNKHGGEHHHRLFVEIILREGDIHSCFYLVVEHFQNLRIALDLNVAEFLFHLCLRCGASGQKNACEQYVQYISFHSLQR